ncbi:hypothetical protein AUG19_08495 [archaeon 13_1_20CM_2_54_9]|nr:MAG: hypothetical protein AUJ07_07175 [Crenarchaeota archaeon 13_1_40CM_3_53_5]OLE74503.1 MAG: hypothetical protein AUG19_08495 [archaeon 13_1_20CM_2_54_9]
MKPPRAAVLIILISIGALAGLYLYRAFTITPRGATCSNGATDYPACSNNVCQYGGTLPNCNSSPNCQYGGAYPNCNPAPSCEYGGIYPNCNPHNPQCKGTAACFNDTVEYIVDGDTLDVGTTRVRLTLVNTPEVGQIGYAGAKQFTAQLCPIGSQALVDEDDGQIGGSYGRTVGVVYCSGSNLNAELLLSGNAVLVTYYCAVSEFSNESWTGCP